MTEKKEDLTEGVEDHGGIITIRSGGNKREWNNIRYKQGMSAKNVGSTKLSMNVATIPPGGVAYAHIHVDFELMLYILEGTVRHIFGAGLKKELINHAGDFIYIEPGVPHEVYRKRRKTPEFIHGDIRRARKRIVWYNLDVSRGTAIPTDSPTKQVSEHDYYT